LCLGRDKPYEPRRRRRPRRSAPDAGPGLPYRSVSTASSFGPAKAKHFVKGVTYGPFAPGSHGAQFPEFDVVERDFALMVTAGINTLRVFTVPPVWLLDAAREAWAQGAGWGCRGRSTSRFSTARRCRARSARDRRWGARLRAARGGVRLSRRQRDPARHHPLARRRARRALCREPRRAGAARASGRARQLRQFPVDRISRRRRFHRFPVLQRLSARRDGVPPLHRAAAQSGRHQAAGADRIRRRFDAQQRSGAAPISCPGTSTPPSRAVSPAPSSSPGPTNGSPAAIRSRTGISAWSIATRGRSRPSPRSRRNIWDNCRRRCALSRASRSWSAPTMPSARWALPRLARAAQLPGLRGHRRQ
jgi:hypothetical protein